MAKTAYIKLADRVDPRLRDGEGENNSAFLEKDRVVEDRKNRERCWWEEVWK
jgi:hypothetical protein